MANDDKISALKFFSIGYVTVNIERGSRKIQALPVESASATDGEVTHKPVQEILSGTDKDGNQFEVKGTMTRDLECEWFPYEDNRATPPNVMRGELVGIYRLANTSQYFWRCMNFRNALRTLEHVVYLYGATPDMGGSGLDFSKCYSVTISPMDGYINIQTTKANDEPFAYTAQINTKEGFVAITDDVGNFFELNSPDTRLMAKNADESYLKIEKRTIDLKADEHIKLTCMGTTVTLTPEMIQEITKVFTRNASTSNTVTSPEVTITCTTGRVNASRWDFIMG